jgi:hypothetical protein
LSPATILIVALQSSAKLSFEGGLEKETPGTAKVEAGVERNRKVQADLGQQYEGLGIDIQPEFLRIIRESAAGGDVAGNTGIALSVLTDPQMIVRTFAPRSPDDKPPAPTPVLLIADEHLTGPTDESQPQLTALPEDVLPHCPLKAHVWMLYEARQIVRGGDQYQEGLQHVQLTKNADGIREVEIVPADDISAAVWSIRIADDDEPPKRFLKAKTKDAKNDRKLVFTDYVLASQLIHWLKEHPPTKDGQKLGELIFSNTQTQDGKSPSYDQAISLAPYKESQDACQPAR